MRSSKLKDAKSYLKIIVQREQCSCEILHSEKCIVHKNVYCFVQLLLLTVAAKIELTFQYTNGNDITSEMCMKVLQPVGISK